MPGARVTCGAGLKETKKSLTEFKTLGLCCSDEPARPRYQEVSSFTQDFLVLSTSVRVSTNSSPSVTSRHTSTTAPHGCPADAAHPLSYPSGCGGRFADRSNGHG
jgi:hypothetical protein